MLIHLGVQAEEDASYLNDTPDNEEMACVYNLLKNSLNKSPQKRTKMSQHIKGVSEETTTGVNRLIQFHYIKLFVINVNDSVTKSKFDILQLS